MCSVCFTLSTRDRKEVERHLQTAQQRGHLRQVKFFLAILAVVDGQSFAQVAVVLRVHAKTVAAWVYAFCCYGLQGVPHKKPTGRPPKLTPTQRAALAPLIDAGPLTAGFSGACWRSPMVQQLIDERFGVFSNVFSSAQLLKNLGLSAQQAAFVAAHLDERKRHAWCTTTWPRIVRLAKERPALLLCGDEASFPPWGTLSDPWARRGHQPLVKTSGTRQGDKVFGVIESFTGRFWYQGQEGQLTAESDMAFLTRLVAQITQPISLIQDGAKYHTSIALQRFFALPTTRLIVFQLPSYSPDDHPIEKLWKKVQKEGTHVQYFPTFEALTTTGEQALLKFAHTPEEILALCSLPTELVQVA